MSEEAKPEPAAPEAAEAEAEETKKKRKKKRRSHAVKPFYRVHAHTNPLADKLLDYPVRPELMDWTRVFPRLQRTPGARVEIADVGCAWGGLAVALAERFADSLVLGLEIRPKVVDYTTERIAKLRVAAEAEAEAASDGTRHRHPFDNLGVLLCNAMKNLPNFFGRGQLKKLFFTFPDPHFKKCKQRRRIINPTLLAEYAYVLADGGVLYTITDVEDLHVWMASCLDAHPLFERIADADNAADPCVELIQTATEEARKVDRNHGKKYMANYRRVPRS